MPPELDPIPEEEWHARGGQASDDAEHDDALERDDREREKQDDAPPWSPQLSESDIADIPHRLGRCQACYRYGYRKRTERGLVCYRCR